MKVVFEHDYRHLVSGKNKIPNIPHLWMDPSIPFSVLHNEETEEYEGQGIPDGVYIAGGCFRSLLEEGGEIQDIDVFFASEEAKQNALAVAKSNGAKVTWECPLGHLINLEFEASPNMQEILKIFSFPTKWKLQFVAQSYYASLEDLLDRFDINACRIGLDNKRLVTYTSTLRDILKKRITLHKAEYPIATLRRILKYADKGYKLTGPRLADALIKLREFPLTEDNQSLYID